MDESQRSQTTALSIDECPLGPWLVVTTTQHHEQGRAAGRDVG